MAIQNKTKERSIEGVQRERAAVPWRYFLVSLSCAVVLAVGFFYAAKQHFASVDYSMRNSDLRKTKDKLEAEQRKLKVEREEASSYATIEKAGMKIGLRKFTSQDFQFIDASKNVSTPVAPQTTADSKGKNAKMATTKPSGTENKDQTNASKTAVAKTSVKEIIRKTAIARK